MKKILFITCAALFALTSCSNDDELVIESNNPLQLVQITERTSYDGIQFNDTGYSEYTYGSNGFVSTIANFTSDGNPAYSKNYSYNSNNQLTELTLFNQSITTTQTFTYEDGLLVKSEFSPDNAKIYTYSNENNTISVFRTISPGTIEDATYIINFYPLNNTSNVTDYYGNIEQTYTYDIMKNPMLLLFPPDFLNLNSVNKHNISTESEPDGLIGKSYEYEYNSEGYPLKKTMTGFGGIVQINEYVYN